MPERPVFPPILHGRYRYDAAYNSGGHCKDKINRAHYKRTCNNERVWGKWEVRKIQRPDSWRNEFCGYAGIYDRWRKFNCGLAVDRQLYIHQCVLVFMGNIYASFSVADNIFVHGFSTSHVSWERTWQGQGANILNQGRKLGFQEKTALFIVFIMIVFWISEPLTGIDPVIVAFAGVVLLAMPGIEILREEDLKSIDWHTIILLGTAFSLGKLLNEEGVGDKAANWLVYKISALNSDFPGLSFLGLLLFLCMARDLFISSVSFLTLAMPVVLPVSESMDLNPLFMGLSTAIVAGVVNVLPTQSPGLIMLHNTYRFTFKEFLFLSWVSTFLHISFTGPCCL